jgi:chloramphenicol-sensitive protein RarD
MLPKNNNSSGLLLAISAFSLFSVIPVYLQLLQPLSGYTVLFHRILWTSLLLVVFMLALGKFKSNLLPLLQPKEWPGLIAGSLLIGVQWGVFVWAPLNGQTLDLSLGYFLLPLVMVLAGKLFYAERLRIKQWIALGFAAIVVGIAYLQSNGLSLVVVIIIVGYPVYLMLRRHQRLPTFSAFLIENILLLPVAIVGIMLSGGLNGEALPHPFAYDVNWLFLFIGVAVLGAVPMLCYIAANSRLPLGLLGLISYLEPTLIFIFAFLFMGETLTAEQSMTYVLIAVGLAITLWDGIEQWKIQRRYIKYVKSTS